LENFGKTPARHVLYFAELYSPAAHEASADRGLRFHARHLDEYRSAMFFMADILPNEKLPIQFGPNVRIEELLHGDSHKPFSLCLSFHTAYRQFHSMEVGEIGAIYMIVGHPQKMEFGVDDLNALDAFLMELPNCRRIT
jgi:hypothetical protein